MKNRIVAVVVIVVILTLAGLAQERVKNICKAAHLGPRAVAISCTDGADPTVVPQRGAAGVLLVSCGK